MTDHLRSRPSIPPCPKCKEPAVTFHEVNTEHLAVAVACPCRPNHARQLARAAALKREFDELIEHGVSRELANEVILARVLRHNAKLMEAIT